MTKDFKYIFGIHNRLLSYVCSQPCPWKNCLGASISQARPEVFQGPLLDGTDVI